jgi:hypothetical protein
MGEKIRFLKNTLWLSVCKTAYEIVQIFKHLTTKPSSGHATIY